MAGRQMEVRRVAAFNATTVVEPPKSFPSWFAVRKAHHEFRIDFFFRYIIFSIKDLKMGDSPLRRAELKLGGDGGSYHCGVL